MTADGPQPTPAAPDAGRILTDDGLRRSQALFEAMFTKPPAG